MKCLAPAKVNLYLEILGKCANGYHRIETVMQTVSLYDELIIEPSRQEVRVICDHPLLSKEKDNLILWAVNLLQKFNKKRRGAKIVLKKNIPLASGLGGGSSDAVCVLKGLNQLWELNLSKETLFCLAKKVGADAPFFLQGGYAYAQGVGEKIFSYPFLPNYWLILVNPGLALYSKEVYAKYDRLKLTKRRNFNKIIPMKYRDWQDLSTPEDIAKNLYNRLEEVVLPRYPEITKIKKVLISLGALGSLMSGSGSTVFGIVENEKKGKEIIKKLKRYPWQTWLVKTVASSATCRRGTVGASPSW